MERKQNVRRTAQAEVAKDAIKQVPPSQRQRRSYQSIPSHRVNAPEPWEAEAG